MNTRAIWGALVGDACGATLEFYDDDITEEIARRAMTMPGGGSLRVGCGQITDDGELTLALWSVLKERDTIYGFPLEAMAKAYAAWYASVPFDIGRTCSLAFDMLHEWVHDEKKELTYVLRSIHEMSRLSEANGALMRVTPIATWWVSHPLRMYGGVCVEQTAQFAAASAEEDARLSHPGRATRDANAVYTYAMTLLLLGCSPAETVERVEIMVRKRCAEVQRWVEESKREMSDARVLIGHVRHAFVAALWFLRRPEIGYEEAIHRILMRGGDTDTNAAIVGGLVACYQDVPEAMKVAVATFDCVVEAQPIPSHEESGQSLQSHISMGRPRPKEYGVKYQMGS